jgi:hypothetical protein
MKDLEQLRYPIGKFEYGKKYSIEETRNHIAIIARFPKDLKKTLKKLKNGGLETPYRPDGWTVRQVVNHVADSHMNAFIRMKLAVTEPVPTIKPYDEKRWAETEDGKRGPVKLSVKLISALHRRWVILMTSFDKNDLNATYFHPGNKRTFTVQEGIALYVWHCRHHLAHIELVAKSKSEVKPKKAKFEKATDSALRAPKVKAEKAAVAPKAKRMLSPEHLAKLAAGRAARATASPVTTGRNDDVAAKLAAIHAAKASVAEKTAGAPKDKRVLSPEHLAKLAAGRAARAAASGKTAPAPKAPRAPKVKVEKVPKAPKVKAEKAADAPKAKRVLSPEHLAKLAAGRTAKAAASGKTAPAPKAPKAKVEKAPKAPKVKAEKAADAPKAKRVLSPEHLAKLAAGRTAKAAASGKTAPEPKAPKAKVEKAPKAPKVKAEKAADAPKAKRVLSPEHLAKLAAGRTAKAAASGKTAPAPKAPKAKVEKAPKAPKVKAEKAPKVPKVKAEKAADAPKAKRVLSPEHLAKLAAGRTAKAAASGKTAPAPKAPKAKVEKAPKAPKVKAEKAPKVPKVKAEKAADAPKAKRVLSPEHLAKLAAGRTAKAAASGKTAPAPKAPKVKAPK